MVVVNKKKIFINWKYLHLVVLAIDLEESLEIILGEAIDLEEILVLVHFTLSLYL